MDFSDHPLPAEGQGRFVVLALFVVEHFVVLAMLLLLALVPDVPKDAQRAVLRDAFHAQQLAEADQSRELHDMTGSAGDHSPNYLSLSCPYLWTGRSEGDVESDK